MKKRIIILFIVLLSHLLIYSQECYDFNPNEPVANISHWKYFGVNNVSFPVILSQGGSVLKCEDASGASIIANDIDFKGNWLSKGRCICFKMKNDWNSNVSTGTFKSPKFGIFQGNFLANATDFNNMFKATFVGNTSMPDFEDDKWRKTCLPIGECTNGTLPSNEYGTWAVSKNGMKLAGNEACIAWNELIKNVGGIWMSPDYNNSPSEINYFDSFCFNNCSLPTQSHCNITCCIPDFLNSSSFLRQQFTWNSADGQASTYKFIFTNSTSFKLLLTSIMKHHLSQYEAQNCTGKKPEISVGFELFEINNANSTLEKIQNMDISNSGLTTLRETFMHAGGITSQGFQYIHSPNKWYVIRMKLFIFNNGKSICNIEPKFIYKFIDASSTRKMLIHSNVIEQRNVMNGKLLEY